MTFDLLYQLPGETHWRHCMTAPKLGVIRDRCRKLWGPLAAATQITIIREDGLVVHDTRTDGIDF